MRIAARFGDATRRRLPDGYEPDPAESSSCSADAEASGGSIDVVTDPLGGRRRRRRPLHGRLDEHGPGGGARPAAARPRARTGSTPRSSRWRGLTPSRCTASPRTSARRSPATCCTATARSSGTRPRTGCTRRRPSSRSYRALMRSTTTSARRSTRSRPTSRAALRNVAVVVEDENDDDPDLYGLFEGHPADRGRRPAPASSPTGSRSTGARLRPTSQTWTSYARRSA